MTLVFILLPSLIFWAGFAVGRWYQKNVVKPVGDESEIRKFL